MDNKKKNDCIRCGVSQCQHNMVTEDYCCLDSISVGTHEDNPTVPVGSRVEGGEASLAKQDQP